ncbi:MAG TPA: amidase [Vicinamibacterales bacterium]|nr:amidase [Vicinamibacterales bacterium]
MTRERERRGRRAFLRAVPAAIGAGLVAPAVTTASQAPAGQAPAAGGITAETLGIAQQIAGVALPIDEREAARTLVARNLTNIEAVRRVTLTPDIEPAFSYRPSTGTTGTTGATGPTGALQRALRLRTPSTLPKNLEDLAFEPVHVLAERIRRRQISSSDLTAMYLERLKKHDATLFCVVTMTEDLARDQAAAADSEIRAGKYRGPLHGIPYGIKDLFSVKGRPTTWGAAPYQKQVFDYDATAVTRLREAGAVLLAKLTTGELAVGDLWFGGRTRNPWNPETGASGSSAGPASASAAGLVGFAVGTETNGSIVSPSSTCGVTGLRPTYGRTSRYGCMTLRWTLDKVGAIARSVTDTALVLEAMHGPDGKDETVPPVPFAWDGAGTLKGLRIGFVEREFAGTGPNAPVLTAALDVYRKAGATLTPVTLPETPAAEIYALLNAEAGAMFDELVRSGGINQLADKGPNGRANQLRASRFIPAVDYIRAQRVRTLLLRQMNDVFTRVDAFLAPSSSASVTMTNLTGHPAITVPCGFVRDMPIGLLVTGPLFREEVVLRVASAFEGATDWHTKRPKGF